MQPPSTLASTDPIANVPSVPAIRSAWIPVINSLLTVVWLRHYPIHEVLAYLFAISDLTVSRYISRTLPLLEAAGRDTMRMPDPGKKRRRTLDALLADTPDLVIVIDTF